MNEQHLATLRELTARLNDSPGDVEALMERGKLFFRAGIETMSLAANDFRKVVELVPGHTEAGEFLVMIEDIQQYRYTDLLNP